jgi:hypothetical protein
VHGTVQIRGLSQTIAGNLPQQALVLTMSSKTNPQQSKERQQISKVFHGE